jgi:hypothetical protein
MNISNVDRLPAVAQEIAWAKLLDCDRITLYRARKKGLLKGSKVNNAVVYTRAEILSYLGVKEVNTDTDERDCLSDGHREYMKAYCEFEEERCKAALERLLQRRLEQRDKSSSAPSKRL